jgi:hypothetical protein
MVATDTEGPRGLAWPPWAAAVTGSECCGEDGRG